MTLTGRPARFTPQIVVPGVYRLASLGCWVHALVDAGDVTLIDVGLPGSAPLLLRQLARLGIAPVQVRRIILSHYHIDHMAGVPGLLARTPATVFIHRAEAGSVAGTQPWPMPIVRPSLPSGPTRRVYARLMPRGFPVTPLDDGDVLPVRGGLHVVHTPGHTPGSSALLAAADGLLFCGDALQFRFNRLSGPSSFFTVDMPQARRSIARMAALDFSTLCFAHFRPLPNARPHLTTLATTLPP